MEELDDITLLREFATNESHEAFETLVARYANLVYSAALRQAGNPHIAQEVTQAVFIILAQKAKRISSDTLLIGWLFKTTRFTAMAEARAANRRRRHEEAFQMESNDLQSTPDLLWEEMSPLLDEALAKLGEKDRQALLLRFFENRDLAEVGAFLGANENTAGRRVTRALEKLRGFMARRGVVSTVTLIAGAISANSIQAAPVGLTSTIVATTVKGSAVATSTLTLVKGTMQIMNWIKLKLAVGVTGAVLLAGAVVTAAVSHHAPVNNGSSTVAQGIAKKSQEAYAALTSYSDDGTTVTENSSAPITTTFNIRLQRTNLYRIDWAQSNQFMTSRGVVWSDGTGDFLQMGVNGQKVNAQPQKMQSRDNALGAATGVSSQASATIPAAFFKQNWGDVLALPAAGVANVVMEADEKLGDLDCYVMTTVIDPASLPTKGKLPGWDGKIGKTTTKLWIGKKDYLIHKAQTSIDTASFTLKMTDAIIKKALEGQNIPATPEAITAMKKWMETSSKSPLASMKSGPLVFTQTHENIRLNEPFTSSDFIP